MFNASLSTITERFQACALDLGRWESGLDDIVQSFDVAGAVLLSTDGRFSRPINSRRMHASSDDYMRNGWNLRDERWRVQPKILKVGLATEDDVMSEAERAASPYYQEFLKSHGLGYFVCVGFQAGEDLWAISIQRHHGQSGFSPEQLAAFHQLWRPLSDAATLSRQVSFARVLGATDAYEQMRQPAIALSADLRLIAHNDCASTLRGRLFDAPQGRFRFTEPRNDSAFGTLIRRMRAGALPAAAPASAQMTDGRGGRVPIRLIELTGWSRLAFANARYLLLIGDVEYDAGQAMALLRERFALTPTEARVAFALQSGQSLFDIAAATGTGYETVRKHLRAVFAKIGVRRQAELTAALWRCLGR